MRAVLSTAVLTAILLGTAGCGSGGYSSDMSSAIGGLRDTISTYNAATPTDVPSTGAACRKAADSVKSTHLPALKDAPKAKRPAARALQQAYNLALAGFSDCAAAGATNDYTRMARAAGEIDGANIWLKKAQSLDR